MWRWGGYLDRGKVYRAAREAKKNILNNTLTKLGNQIWSYTEFWPGQINLGLWMKQNERKSIKQQIHQSRHHYRVDQCVCGLTQLHTIAFVIVIQHCYSAFVVVILSFSTTCANNTPYKICGTYSDCVNVIPWIIFLVSNRTSIWTVINPPKILGDLCVLP